MNAYFKPLRRKLGVITLALACVFAAGWFRSHVVADRIAFNFLNRWHDRFVSFRGNVDWEFVEIHYEKRPATMYFGLFDAIGVSFFNSKQDYSPSASDDEQHQIKWHWRWCGIGRGEFGRGTSEVFCEEFNRTSNPRTEIPLDSFKLIVWRFSYWYVISPLTLLSAWLLLSKPRSKLPNATTSH